ncbi:hypothetical protein GIB67_029892 [Kingdonia uniflora]|uniref:Thionin-like protein n=1 Tax=Kingdonia uniflora TaxID=39325 RepID=A0A7J7MQW6_9MAGN|nr:hypothetical protein GIB67_029892 [Kingdonia uniflora]
MKKITVLAVLALFLVSFQLKNVESDAFDCLDACQTGCVASYINDPRQMSRCDSKCTIKCDRGVVVTKVIGG